MSPWTSVWEQMHATVALVNHMKTFVIAMTHLDVSILSINEPVLWEKTDLFGQNIFYCEFTLCVTVKHGRYM